MTGEKSSKNIRIRGRMMVMGLSWGVVGLKPNNSAAAAAAIKKGIAFDWWTL